MALRREPPNPNTRNTNSARIGVVSKSLGDSYVFYHPVLSAVTGNVKAALFLSHALSWAGYIHKTRPDRDGWFWMRANEWQDGTGLSVREQATARQILRNLNVIEEKRIGVPAKMWFRINLDLLGRLVASEAHQEFEHWNWNSKAMLRLLGKPIPCHRLLIKVAESAISGLVLSYIFSTVRRDLVNGGDGEWLHIPVAKSWRTIGITAKQQRLARERLSESGLIDSDFEKCVQPRLLTRLNMGKLAQRCSEILNVIHSLPDSGNMFAEIPQSRVAQSANLELPKTQIKDGPNRESGVAHNANQGWRKGQLPIRKENIQVQPLPTRVSDAPAPARMPGSSSEGIEVQPQAEVILPSKLHDGESHLACKWLAPLPSPLRQQVADEWAGLLDLSDRGIRTVHNRLGLLRKLVQRAKGEEAHPFVPTVAISVAAARERRQQIHAARQQSEPKPENSDAGIEAGRTALKDKMAQLWGLRP